jgi:ABC-type multidrug transport system fused ATPase/permease subunit
MVKTKKESKPFLCFLSLAALFLFALILVFQTSFLMAQSSGDNTVSFENQIDRLPQSPEQLGQLGQNYLRTSLSDFLNKSNQSIAVIKFYTTYKTEIDSASKFFVGVPPSLSWFYLLNLIFWVSFGIWVSRIAEIFKIISGWVKFIASTIIAWALAYIGLARNFSSWIVDSIAKLTGDWMLQLFAIIGVIFALIYLNIFSSVFRNWAMGLRREVRMKSMEGKIGKLKSKTAAKTKETKETKETKIINERLTALEEVIARLREKNLKERGGEGLTEEQLDEIEEEVAEDIKSLDTEE